MKPEDLDRIFSEALNAGDVERMLSLYEPGAKLIQRNGQVVRTGAAEIREALEQMVALKGKMEIDVVYSHQMGDIALLQARWRFKATRPDGTPIAASAHSIEVARRQPDGRWLYIIDHPYGGEAYGGEAAA